MELNESLLSGLGRGPTKKKNAEKIFLWKTIIDKVVNAFFNPLIYLTLKSSHQKTRNSISFETNFNERTREDSHFAFLPYTLFVLV